MSVIPCHRGGYICNWPACPQDCDGRPAADAYSAARAPRRFASFRGGVPPMVNHPNRRPECIAPLERLGISASDAFALRRIAMTLHRWHELECGIDGGGVERDETTGKTFWYDSNTGRRSPYYDKETPALKRLAKLMARYPMLASYVQGDPRGAALYILRPGDVPDGKDVDAYYSRGVAVYQ